MKEKRTKRQKVVVRTKGQKNERMNKWKNEWINEWMNERINE